ncbi:GFA family protein [Rhizobium sp. CB3171]|uniref:GFA family protein n=1 Tax=Rhizobium sp. CB3171 TaxID=3039157 RepID=UPI0024B17D65|nr:GFA family protein [Rhizobium sp. CB3171]WFU02966.1 GFA family protein [Rhizobium sp. CB3171]
MTMAMGYSGGCQCGAVRYRAAGAIGYPHLCHCRMCQKASGNYALPLGSAQRSDFELTRGEPSWFHSSDLVRRGFCSACGTPLFYDIPGTDFINLTLGSLDEPMAVQPVAQSNLAGKMPWFHALDALPVEPDGDGSDRDLAIRSSNHQHPDHDTQTWPQEKSHD